MTGTWHVCVRDLVAERASNEALVSVSERLSPETQGDAPIASTTASDRRWRILNRTPGGDEDMTAGPIGRHRVAMAGVWD